MVTVDPGSRQNSLHATITTCWIKTFQFGYQECARARCRDTGCLRTHAECLEEIFHTSAEISYKGCVTKVLQKIDLIYSVPHGDYQ